MINKILIGIIKLITGLVSTLLAPIDLLIEYSLPDLSNALNSISSFLNLAFSSIGWAVSLLGIPAIALKLIVAYYSFKLTIPLAVSAVKLALKWYNSLKL